MPLFGHWQQTVVVIPRVMDKIRLNFTINLTLDIHFYLKDLFWAINSNFTVSRVALSTTETEYIAMSSPSWNYLMK
jgi:hypothetical protein